MHCHSLSRATTRRVDGRPHEPHLLPLLGWQQAGKAKDGRVPAALEVSLGRVGWGSCAGPAFRLERLWSRARSGLGMDGVERVGEAGCSCRATIAGDDAAPNERGGVGEEAAVLVSSVYERAVGVVSSDRERLRCGRAQTGRKGFSEEIGQGRCVLLCQSGEFVGRHRHACRYRDRDGQRRK